VTQEKLQFLFFDIDSSHYVLVLEFECHGKNLSEYVDFEIAAIVKELCYRCRGICQLIPKIPSLPGVITNTGSGNKSFGYLFDLTFLLNSSISTATL